MNTEKFLITAKQLADEMNEKEILIFHQREEIKKIENELELIRLEIDLISKMPFLWHSRT